MITAIIVLGLTTGVVVAAAIVEYVEMRSVIQTRSHDTVVTSVATVSGERGKYPDEAVITFSNPSSKPVMVGISARTEFWTCWFRLQQSARVISRPRRRHRVTAQSTIGVIPAHGSSRMPVRIPYGRRRCRVVALTGEADGRLRVMSVRVPRNASVPVNWRVKGDRADVSDFDVAFYWFI